MSPLSTGWLLSMRRCLFTQFACIVIASACVAGEEDSIVIVEILKKADDALAPPVQYRIRLNTLETTVSRKFLSNGILASRTEAVEPTQTITIELGDDLYDVLPQSRVVIDKGRISTRNLPVGMVRKSDQGLYFIPKMLENSEVSRRQLTMVVRSGKEYYEIETQYSHSLSLLGSLVLPPELQAGIRARRVLLVDRTTNTPVEMEYFSPTGSSIARYEYIEIARSPEISDDLFELPSEYAVKTPKTMNEYYDLHREYWNDNMPTPKRPPFFPTIYEVEESKYAKMANARAGRDVVPIGMTVEDMKTRIEVIRKESRQMMHDDLVRNEDNGIRRMIILANLILVLVVALMLMLRRHRRLKSDRSPHT